MTDPGTADRTYIGPMSADLVEEIIEKVWKVPLAYFVVLLLFGAVH